MEAKADRRYRGAGAESKASSDASSAGVAETKVTPKPAPRAAKTKLTGLRGGEARVPPDIVEQSIWTTTWEAEKAGAVTSGFLPFAASLADRRVAELAREMEEKKTPLWIACDKGDTDAARLLLDRGAEVDEAAEGATTALFAALDKGHADTVRLLMERGAEIERNGYTNFLVACVFGDVEAVGRHLDGGAESTGRTTGVGTVARRMLERRPRRRGAAAAGQRRGGRPRR